MVVETFYAYDVWDSNMHIPHGSEKTISSHPCIPLLQSANDPE
jgi:hypothetical protein